MKTRRILIESVCSVVFIFALILIMPGSVKAEGEKAHVTFDYNGGTGDIEYFEVEINTSYGTLPIPTKDGFNFLGWYTDSQYGVGVNSSSICTGNITLYAHWTDQASYTVEYYVEKVDDVKSYTLMKREKFYGKINSRVPDCYIKYDGLSSKTQSFNSSIILADGSTKKAYYYSRNTYHLSWDLNGGDWMYPDGSHGHSVGDRKYGSNIYAPELIRKGFSFKGWSPEFTGYMPAGDTKYVAIWEGETVTYNVYHYKENKYGQYESYTDKQTKSGIAGSEVTPEVMSYEGYRSPETITVTIKGEGNTTVQYYYNRNSYTLTWDFDGGTPSGKYTPAGACKYLTDIEKPYCEKEGYEFVGWSSNLTYMPAYNLTLKALFKEKYTVEHYKQKVDGKYNQTPDEIDNLLAFSGTRVTPKVRNYTGFTSPKEQTVTIEANGTTVIKYYYERNSYTLTWDFDGGTTNYAYTPAGKYMFGKNIEKPNLLSKPGFRFCGWNVNITSMPANDLTLKAVFSEKYKVEHYKQNIDGTYSFSPDKVDEFYGVTGESITPNVMKYTGFESPLKQTVILEGDAKTVIKYYYERKSYTLTWDFQGGTASGVALLSA